MKQDTPNFAQALSLAAKVDGQYRLVWDGRSPEHRAALALYFLPHRSSKPTLVPTRPRVIKWYCPFACQSDFPSGHRYCINVYVGCSHGCLYCFAFGYAPCVATIKKGFQRMVDRDMDDLERFDVPPGPVHLSNSTDPFQSLEADNRHTQYALAQLLAHRRRFTSVTILTKNPLLPVRLGYIDLFKKLAELPSDHPRAAAFPQGVFPGFSVEVSLAFWREEARQTYDPGAPTVEERKEGIRALREAGIPVVLRIDPLFPRSPLADRCTQTYADFGLAEPQTAADIESLVGFAKEMGVRHVVYSAAKIVQPRGKKLSLAMQAMRQVYEYVAAPDRPLFRGGSWRLPSAVAEAKVTQPFLQTCGRLGVAAKYCKSNLVETP